MARLTEQPTGTLQNSVRYESLKTLDLFWHKPDFCKAGVLEDSLLKHNCDQLLPVFYLIFNLEKMIGQLNNHNNQMEILLRAH